MAGLSPEGSRNGDKKSLHHENRIWGLTILVKRKYWFGILFGCEVCAGAAADGWREA